MDHHKIPKKQLRIAHETRKQLIRLVTCEKLSVKFAHLQLGINYSTAKMIVRKYKQSGKITRFRRQRKAKPLESMSEDSGNGCCSENRDSTVKKENENPNLLQHISPLQFQTFYNPHQDCGQMMNVFGMESQYYYLPQMFLSYAVPNYFLL